MFALIDVNTQEDFISSDPKIKLEGNTDIISKIERLISLAEYKKVVVISLDDEHGENDAEFEGVESHCISGSKGAAKVPASVVKKNHFEVFGMTPIEASELKYQPGLALQFVFNKKGRDVFAETGGNPNFKKFLEINKVDTVGIYGVLGDKDVVTLARGLEAMGVRSIFVFDAIVGARRETLNAYGERMSTQTLIEGVASGGMGDLQ